VTQPPQIFDRKLLRLRQARAQRLAALRAQRSEKICDFLIARTADELAFRLSGVFRDFPRVLDFSAPHPGISEVLVAPGRKVLRAGSIFPSELIADEECLPFAPESFDLVVSALNLNFVNDLPGALAQLRRTLAPDGLLLAALIGGQTLRELRICLAQAQEEIERGASPRVAPFVDLRDLGGLLQRAGLALPVVDADSFTVRYANALDLMHDLRFMGATNVLVAGARRPLRRDVVFRAAELYRELFADADGRIRATFEIIWASGWAPHESQQKPLAPGSATARLSDVLGDKSSKS
jgi:SAM-dependent methyltransferase